MIPGLKAAPGFFSSAGSMAGATLSFVTSAVSASGTINWPSVQAGDLAVMSDTAHSGGSGIPSDVIPAGFTGIDTIADNAQRWRGSYKKCTGTESGAITGMNGAILNSKVLMIFRSTGTITTITPSVFDMQNTTGSPAQRTIAASAGVAPLIVFGLAFSTASNPSWTTQTPSWAATITGAARSNVGYRIYNANPVTNQIIDMGDSGWNIMVGGYLRVA